MNRTDRLVAMVMFLQGRRVVRAEELAAHFEITVRTVYRDFSALSEAGVPVSGEPGVGYSLVKGYHLPPVMFTAEEAMALFIGAEMVKRFADASLAAPMESALLKIRSVLPRDRQDDLDRLGRATVIVGTPHLPDGIDQRTLLPIQQAIVARRVVRISYRAREQEENTVREVEPLGVMYFNAAWYLVAWCRLRGAFRHFKLDRLVKLDVTHEQFPARPTFSLQDHLKQEMTASDRLEVRIWFSSRAIDRARRESSASFLAERPTDNGVEVEMCTFSYDWLARWLLSFGDEAEAIAPAELRGAIGALAASVADRYALAVT